MIATYRRYWSLSHGETVGKQMSLLFGHVLSPKGAPSNSNTIKTLCFFIRWFGIFISCPWQLFPVTHPGRNEGPTFIVRVPQI